MAARSANAMQMPNLRMPTGYESEQRKIEAKRRIAQAMLAQGIAPDKINHWTQVLAKLAQTWVGKSEDDKATKMEGAMYDRMQGDLAEKMSRYQQMRNSGATNQQIVDAFVNDPMLADVIKPHADALGTAMKNAEGLFDTGGAEGYQRKGDYIGKPLPIDPNKPVMINPQTGAMEVNPVRATAAMAAQGLVSPRPGDPAGMVTPTYSMPTPGGAPTATPAPSGMNLDISKLNPEEQQILKAEIQRRAGLTPEAQNYPQGSPLSPPPSKVVNGQGYWFVNGQWYDNPEGK